MTKALALMKCFCYTPLKAEHLGSLGRRSDPNTLLVARSLPPCGRFGGVLVALIARRGRYVYIGSITARIQFRAATSDEQGQITHRSGEVITGKVIDQRQDFLFVQTIDSCLCIDTSRGDLYNVELQRVV